MPPLGTKRLADGYRQRDVKEANNRNQSALAEAQTNISNVQADITALESSVGTRTTGATSVADGGAVTHNLGTTPAKVNITPTVAGTIPAVTAVGSTTFTVALKTAAGTPASTQTIYWEAIA